MKKDDFSELRSFLSGYFHQDWELDASEPDEVVLQFIKRKPGSSKSDQIIEQIERYLDAEIDDEAVERDLFEEFGCYYLPSADGSNARDWLRHVADLLKTQ